MKVLGRTSARKLAPNTRIVGFGAGEIGENTVRFLGASIFSAFYDNLPAKQTVAWLEGIVVHSPAFLRDEPLGTLVLICSDHYEAIEAQVSEINPLLKCYLSPILKDSLDMEKISNCSRSLLVSAYHLQGGLYHINGRTRHVQLLRKGAFRGLTRAGDLLLVAEENGNIWEVSQDDSYCLALRHLSPEYTDTHGLAYWARENLLLTVDSHFDRVSFWRLPDFLKIRELSLRQSTSTDLSDQYHINDLCLVGDTIFFSVFSQSGWCRSGIHDGAIMAMPLLGGGGSTPIITGLLHPHSVRFINGQLTFLESSSGIIRTGGGFQYGPLPGFLRGLEGNGEIYYIGQSRHRRRELCGEVRHLSMDSGIYVLERASKISRFIQLPEQCDIYDILDLEIE